MYKKKVKLATADLTTTDTTAKKTFYCVEKEENSPGYFEYKVKMEGKILNPFVRTGVKYNCDIPCGKQ